MRLVEGAQAPDFEAQDWSGTAVRLSEVAGKRWLAFFRYASCPLCNLRVHQIIERHVELSARGITVLAVFQSSRESIARYVGEQKPPFSLLADPAEELYARYGLETSIRGYASLDNLGPLCAALRLGFRPGKPEGSATRLPADFLIDSCGTIRRAYYARVIADHIPFADVERFLA